MANLDKPVFQLPNLAFHQVLNSKDIFSDHCMHNTKHPAWGPYNCPATIYPFTFHWAQTAGNRSILNYAKTRSP